MKCFVCFNSSIYVCPCNRVYLCSYHLGVHLESGGSHPFEKLIELPENESIKYKKEILTRINSIDASKTYIQKETKNLISLIEKCANSALKELDKILDSYLEFMSSNKIYLNQIKEINDLFKCDRGLSRTGLKLDLSVIESYEILMNCLPSNKWPDHKKVRYLEMNFNALCCTTKIIISNDGKKLFRCKIYAGMSNEGIIK